MKNWKLIGIAIVALGILVWGIIALGTTTVVRYTGKKVIAIITMLPKQCDKYNSIEVLVGNTSGSLPISKKECRDGYYKLGQKVEVIQKEGYTELVWPQSQPGVVILLIIGILCLGYYTEKGKLKQKVK